MTPRIPVVMKDVGFPVYALAWQNDDVIIAPGGVESVTLVSRKKSYYRLWETILTCSDYCQSKEPARQGHYPKRRHCVWFQFHLKRIDNEDSSASDYAILI